MAKRKSALKKKGSVLQFLHPSCSNSQLLFYSNQFNKNLIEIKSPTPGTFYSQEKPGSPTYVAVGAKVNPKTVVCQIEAMKLFNEIAAECTGTIVEILIENKQPVEYGQVLFRVDPNG
jgi:acetyl-CoA carboxylase biotin carboxyl carrier protein